MKTRRFDAPTNFKTSDATNEMRRARSSVEHDDGVENDVDKASRELAERSQNAWKTKRQAAPGASAVNVDGESELEKASREMHERTLNAWKPKAK